MALETTLPQSTSPIPPDLRALLKKKAGEEPSEVKPCLGCIQVANNQSENKQFKAACRAAGGLSKGQQRMFHLRVTGQGFTYPELVDIACEIKADYPNK